VSGDPALEAGLSEFNTFWYKYSWHNWRSNDHSSSRLTQHLFLHYLGTKIWSQKN